MANYEKIKTKDNYIFILKSGMFWELYPELTGNWDEDRKIINPEHIYDEESSDERMNVVGQNGNTGEHYNDTIIIDTLVSFETSARALEKGFNIKSIEHVTDKVYDKFSGELKNWVHRPSILAPTQSVLQKWLREVHDIHIIIVPYNNYGKIDYTVANQYPYHNIMTGTQENGSYNSYEEALEVGLLQGLKMIK